MKIYVASSWRNPRQADVVAALRDAGHLVYDYREPDGFRDGPSPAAPRGFHWSDIHPAWKTWDPKMFVESLQHPIARLGFTRDMDALATADATVLVLPCGRSAHLELGYAVGAGQRTLVLMETPQEPELMYRMCDGVCTTLNEVIQALKEEV